MSSLMEFLDERKISVHEVPDVHSVGKDNDEAAEKYYTYKC